MRIVQVTNKVAVIGLIALMYWVFAGISIIVFDFKVFSKNFMELFVASIFGIFVILLGAVILNVMFNLTAIAEKEVRGTISSSGKPTFPKGLIVLFLLSFCLLFTTLYYADYRDAQKREVFLVKSVKSTIEGRKELVEKLTDYEHSLAYFHRVRKELDVLTKIDENFPDIRIIVQDQIHAQKVFLSINSYYTNYSSSGEKEFEPVLFPKEKFIYGTSDDERTYLNSVFSGETSEYKFSTHDDTFELFYPILSDKGTVVLYLTKRNQYAK